MHKLGLNEIRKLYLNFFESKGHLCLNSFSLVPQNDPSILLINAGMTPLKPYFKGTEEPPCTRVTTCQKCIRTPDIERVGLTSRHGTYFEMLGNFSFGDYFKKEAITWAWEFVTQVLKMPEERLYVTVYFEDDEAYDIWHKDVGLPAEKIFRLGKEDNFWEHGTGPCGPCSEIFFDRGEEFGPNDVIGGEGDRFVEFWNLVFSQFDRQEDGTYLPLAKKNIDTGGGLERFACLMQGVDNLFEVDTVRKILDAVCDLASYQYGSDAKKDVAVRVITDHVRSTTMMISDGVLPSNEGRGYVLRRLLRRAARYGLLLNIEGTFLNKIVPVVIAENEEAYPDLVLRKNHILRVFETEEQRFAATLKQGSQLLDQYIDELKNKNEKRLSGEAVFKLHDTYGFPVDLTKEILRESGFTLDDDEFKLCMNKQKNMAREALKAKGNGAWAAASLPTDMDCKNETIFTGYQDTVCEDARLLAIIARNDNNEVELRKSAGVDEEVVLVFDKTCFYATSGGQEGDRGYCYADGTKLEILSTEKTEKGIFLHKAKILNGFIEENQKLRLEIDQKYRKAVSRNHSATHLLHKALREVLGTHVTQAGSYQNDEKTRFDITHMEALTSEQIKRVEELVLQDISANYPVLTEIMSLEDAKKSGAMALFGEKYKDQVRVVKMGSSIELCGGTHVKTTGEINYFKIINETSVASGVRRIEALTSEAAFKYVDKESQILHQLSALLKVKSENLSEKILSLQAELKESQNLIDKLQREKTLGQIDDLLQTVIEINNLKILVAKVVTDNSDNLRELAQSLKDKLGVFSVVLLASINEDKLNFVAAAGKSAVENKKIHCGNLVKMAASLCEGGGGGRPDMAMAGAKNLQKLPQALDAVVKELQNLN